MKKINMKKFMALVMVAVLAFALTACGNEQTAQVESEQSTDQSQTEQAQTDDSKEYKIAIVKQMDHASLDEIANAVASQLDTLEEENGFTNTYEIFSGQNDQTVLSQIGAQIISDEYDAIIPIATLAAQVMTLEAQDSQTPVIYAAVSDPEAAELTGIDHVTGMSDALNTNLIMDMMFAQNPDIQTVGLLYSLSEANSAKPIEEAKAYLDEKGIAYSEKTANTNDEVIAAAGALASQGVDAIFTPTDNVIMAAELSIFETLIDAGITHYTGADSFVRNGAFATCGVNYTKLGAESASLAMDVLLNGMETAEDFYLSEGGIITVNTETAAAMNIDYSVFEDMGEVVEVVTTAE